jgi:hypothetical protein
MSNLETHEIAKPEPTPKANAEKGEILSLDHAKEALIHSDRLKTKLLFAIDKIKLHPQWKDKVVDGLWNKLSAKDRELLYQGGKPGIFKMLKKGLTPVPLNLLPFDLTPSMKYDDNRLKFFGDKLSDAARPLVQMDMLPAPEGIPGDEIAKDVLSDKKSIQRILSAVQVLVTLFAPEAAKEVQEAKAIANQLVDLKTDMATEQQKKKAA